MSETIDERIARLHRPGVIDMHFDLPMDLYDKRGRKNVLATDFLEDLEAGDIGVAGAAIYLDDRYLPEMALRAALDQVARLYIEVGESGRFTICRSHREILQAREEKKIALLLTMEGVEPLGSDLDLLRVFYELGLRSLCLTHVRRNAAGDGALFAASGSPRGGLTPFGREVIRECEKLGIIIDLAHLSPAGFDEVLEMTTKPTIISHANARKYYDIERNVTDEQIKAIGARGGVIGINAVLVSPHKEEATLDRYVDHIEHVRGLIGIEGVAIGFDFFEFIYRQWSEAEQVAFQNKFTNAHFVPDLQKHSQSRGLTRRLIERGFADDEIERILFRNWMRIFEQWLGE
ncbi:MAG TPA: membrane dipeptidase [Chthoniobacterales bacterium]|nr:membrane dipeptidase [Chthoniobacterales bacterium]